MKSRIKRRPVGRPPEGTDGKVREQRVEIRISVGELAELARRAAAACQTVPAYVRDLALRS